MFTRRKTDPRWGRIRNRRGLETTCCECYRLIQGRYEKLTDKVK